jgi:hypothetical protein
MKMTQDREADVAEILALSAASRVRLARFAEFDFD